MAQKLGLQHEGETAFMDAYSRRVRALLGDGHFRTGVSLRALFKELPELPRPGSSEDRFILFVSFPYFGGSSQEIAWNSESESVKLLDFKRLGLGLPARRAPASEEERDEIEEVPGEEGGGAGEILVHQARYMIFDNCKPTLLPTADINIFTN